MTNYDLIRNMSEQRMARFLCANKFGSCLGCPHYKNKNEKACSVRLNAFRKWLKEKTKDGE